MINMFYQMIQILVLMTKRLTPLQMNQEIQKMITIMNDVFYL